MTRNTGGGHRIGSVRGKQPDPILLNRPVSMTDTTQRIPEPLNDDEALIRSFASWGRTAIITHFLRDRSAANERIAVLEGALRWAMAPNPRYEGRHRTEPRCSAFTFMPTDASCNCGYEHARATLGATETEPGEGT